MATKAPRQDEAELAALSRLLTEKANAGKLSGISFLLADNRDCSPNDFAHDIRVMLEHHYARKTRDVTDAIRRGEIPGA